MAYGLLELGVAGGALLVPFGLHAADAIRIAICGGQPELPAASGALEVCLDSALAFVLILLPTACMGATLPLLARHAEGARDGHAIFCRHDCSSRCGGGSALHVRSGSDSQASAAEQYGDDFGD